VEHEHEPAQTPPAQPPVEEPPAPAEPTQPVEPEPRHRESIGIGPRFYATLAALLFFIAYSIAFVVGNDRHTPIDFVFVTANVSVVWMILLLLAVGLVGGILLVELYRHRRGKLRREP
jgi:uncharacterized integral membrane protein